jgi:hypothetical protein
VAVAAEAPHRVPLSGFFPRPRHQRARERLARRHVERRRAEHGRVGRHEAHGGRHLEVGGFNRLLAIQKGLSKFNTVLGIQQGLERGVLKCNRDLKRVVKIQQGLLRQQGNFKFSRGFKGSLKFNRDFKRELKMQQGFQKGP